LKGTHPLRGPGSAWDGKQHRFPFIAAAVANYVSSRELNKSNSVAASGYTTVDTSLGYQAGRYRVQLNGYDLTGRRDPFAGLVASAHTRL